MQLPEQPLTTLEKLQRILRFTWILPGAGLLLVVGIFILRWQEGQRFEQQQREQQQQESEANRRAFENLGGNRFEILHFYAVPPIVRRGEAVQLCYGVSNATAVRLEPPAARVWPAANRCMEITLRKTTTYTLTAENAAGEARTSTLEVKVQ